MLASVLTKSLRDQRRSLVGWSAAIAVLVVLMAAIWPSMRDMPNLEEFIAGYPEALRELFNFDAITTGAGFLNAELYSIMLPAVFLIFGIGRGARLVAGEEEARTLEAVLVTPVPRIRLLVEKAFAIAVSITVLGAALFVVTAVSSAVVGMDVAVAHAAGASVSMVLLGLEHGWLALAVGAATGRKSLAIGVATTVAAAGYLLYILGQIVDVVRPWQPLSPFAQALKDGPLGTGLPAAYAWMALAAAAFLVAALPVFDRRDIATA